MAPLPSFYTTEQSGSIILIFLKLLNAILIIFQLITDKISVSYYVYFTNQPQDYFEDM